MPRSTSSENQASAERTLGVISLTFIAAGGILGSGWLFTPLLTAQLAGPASLVAWVIGAVAMILLAISFAEITAILPVSGGIARIPRFTHGDITSAVIGWTAWIGYATQAPIEVSVMLQYAAVEWPWLFEGAANLGSMTFKGYLVAAGFLAFFVFINALGAQVFAKTNNIITVLKFFIPTFIAIVFIVSYFEPHNFDNPQIGGFSPYGIHGVLTAVSTGGIIFSLIGFRHAIDMAGEAKNPKVTIPIALMLGLIIPLGIYFLLQVSFIGVLTPDDLKNGWGNIHENNNFGPLAAVSAALGLHWLMAAIYGGVIVGPMGGALVATGSSSRLVFALARNKFIPRLFEKLSNMSVPVNALVLNFFVGLILLYTLPFKEIIAVNSAAITLSFTAGPLGVYALRKQLPDIDRGFKIPAMQTLTILAFIVATLIIYWSGWKTNLVLLSIIAFSIIFLLFKRVLLDKKKISSLDIREALWIPPYIALFMTISYFGNFGGGNESIPFGIDILILSIGSTGVFFIAAWCRLSNKKARILRERHM